MRVWFVFGISVLLCVSAFGEPRTDVPFPVEFEIGRRTFFDFGPPFDFYEVFLIKPITGGLSIERITLTPSGNSCLQSAKVEYATATLGEDIPSLLGHNPCAIPEKEFRKEIKRCRKCLVFSGAVVAMRAQCSGVTRIIHADILDRDMFGPSGHTPTNTRWTMNLLGRIDNTVGPGVTDKPMFAVSSSDSLPQPLPQSLYQIGLGTYDELFEGAPDKPSVLLKDAQNKSPRATVKLVSSSPLQPVEFALPGYPPLARLTRVEGQVIAHLKVDSSGNVNEVTFESGHPLLRPATVDALTKWRFGAGTDDQDIRAIIDYKTNCP